MFSNKCNKCIILSQRFDKEESSGSCETQSLKNFMYPHVRKPTVYAKALESTWKNVHINELISRFLQFAKYLKGYLQKFLVTFMKLFNGKTFFCKIFQLTIS